MVTDFWVNRVELTFIRGASIPERMKGSQHACMH